jgi:hypothetical protein
MYCTVGGTGKDVLHCRGYGIRCTALSGVRDKMTRVICRVRGKGDGGSSLHSGMEFGRSRTGEGSSGGRKKGVV